MPTGSGPPVLEKAVAWLEGSDSSDWLCAWPCSQLAPKVTPPIFREWAESGLWPWQIWRREGQEDVIGGTVVLLVHQHGRGKFDGRFYDQGSALRVQARSTVQRDRPIGGRCARRIPPTVPYADIQPFPGFTRGRARKCRSCTRRKCRSRCRRCCRRSKARQKDCPGCSRGVGRS